MSIHFANQRFLILGAGVTGSAVAKALKSRGGLVTITDDNSHDAVKPEDVDLANFDAVVISPGWRQDHPLVKKVLASSLLILNEIDLAWQIRSEVSPGQKWLALTGTNGKTTSVEMVAKILQTAGFKAVACGNVGDTGSLALGGAIAGLAATLRVELLLIPLGGLFVIITMSVLIQTFYFKISGGKRVFKMAPLHHHFELVGWEQITIVIRFWIIAGLSVAAGLGLFYAQWVAK